MRALKWVSGVIKRAAGKLFCCCGCPTEDLDIVIAGTDPCALNCYPTSNPSFWVSATMLLTGGRTLTYTDLGPFLPPVYIQSVGYEGVEYFSNEECDEEPVATGAVLIFTLVCHPTPNEFGKRLGFVLTLDGSVDVTLADLDSNDADWFGFDEEVELVTPCGTFTLTVPSP